MVLFKFGKMTKNHRTLKMSKLKSLLNKSYGYTVFLESFCWHYVLYLQVSEQLKYASPQNFETESTYLGSY